MKHIALFLAAAALLLAFPRQGIADDVAKNSPKAEKRTDKKPRPPKKEISAKPPSNRPTRPQTERKSPPSLPQRTFLGVATSPVSPDLREHLDLDEGFGIQIQDTIEGSPAEKSGLKKHDILIQFEDQRLIGPEHLSLLVRTKKVGDAIELTLIRKGKQQVMKVTLGETDESMFAPRTDPRAQHLRGPHPPGFDQRDPEKWQEYMRKQQDQFRNWFVPRGSNQAPPSTGGPPRTTPKVEGRPPAVSVNPGFPVRVLGTQGVIKIDNQEGEVTITEKEGKHTIEIRDGAGKVVHEGAFDSEKGIESLPEAAKEHLKKMKLENLEVLAPKAKSEVKKTSSPREKASDPSTTKKGIL